MSKRKPPPSHEQEGWEPASIVFEPTPTPVKRPEGETKQGAPLKHDWIKIAVEAAFREASATHKERSRSGLAEAKKLRAWCGRELKKRPSLSDLRDLVTAVRRRFRQRN